jgi:transposase InsO family protein
MPRRRPILGVGTCSARSSGGFLRRAQRSHRRLARLERHVFDRSEVRYTRVRGARGQCLTLKRELAHHRRFATREEAKREITEYIEIFYNRIRKPARLGYLSPAAFNQRYYAQQMAA